MAFPRLSLYELRTPKFATNRTFFPPRPQIHVHSDGFESLYKYVPKEMLPEEYGGNAGPVKQINGELKSPRRSEDLPAGFCFFLFFFFAV